MENNGRVSIEKDGAVGQKVHWEAKGYDESMAFVSRYGEDLIDWLNPAEGETILDYGCGTGDLAAIIASKGAVPHGLDISPEMVERARAKYPDLVFYHADGMGWQAEVAYDAVFSNAALHWMRDPDSAARSMLSGLREGGRFVAEFGGHGNVGTIVAAVKATMAEEGREAEFVMPWYFPTVGEYASLLEKHGMEVRFASLLDRPTDLKNGDEGMADWIRMFGTAMFPGASAEDADRWIKGATEKMKTKLYDGTGWKADYRRIRIYAVKAESTIR